MSDLNIDCTTLDLGAKYIRPFKKCKIKRNGKKLTIRLVPRTSVIKTSIIAAGYNPLLEVICSGYRTVAEFIWKLMRRWKQKINGKNRCVASSPLRLFPFKNPVHKGWGLEHDQLTMVDLFKQVVSDESTLWLFYNWEDLSSSTTHDTQIPDSPICFFNSFEINKEKPSHNNQNTVLSFLNNSVGHNLTLSSASTPTFDNSNSLAQSHVFDNILNSKITTNNILDFSPSISSASFDNFNNCDLGSGNSLFGFENNNFKENIFNINTLDCHNFSSNTTPLLVDTSDELRNFETLKLPNKPRNTNITKSNIYNRYKNNNYPSIASNQLIPFSPKLPPDLELILPRNLK